MEAQVKSFPFLCCSSMFLAGCQVMPDLSDTTAATLRFRVHYQTPGLTTPHVEVTTTTSTMANQCVYVNDPFGIVANVADPEGVQSITIGPSLHFERVNALSGEDQILAIPSPAEPTQSYSGDTIANPGVSSNGKVVRAAYSTAKAFSTVNLLSVYTFHDSSRALMRATARNWGPSTGVAEVYHFHVEKAQASDPSRQPGMPCSVPPGGV